MRILLIEDDKGIASFIVKGLKQAGYVTEHAVDGKEGLWWLLNEAFDAAVVAPVEAIFNRGPYPTSGGQSIVNATGWDAVESYAVDWVPSHRMIVDLSNLQNSLAIHTTGQSGHAYHQHYVDMVDMWRNIEYHPMHWERLAIEADAEGHLRLIPE